MLLPLLVLTAFAGAPCTKGDVCLEEGERLAGGLGAPPNRVAALEYYVAGCELGHRGCCSRVRSAYENGDGVPLNLAIASEWEAKEEALPKTEAVAYETREPKLKSRCLEQDDAYGCWLWDRLTLATPTGPALEKGCELGDPMACRSLGELDPDRKRESREKCCAAGNYACCYEVIHDTPEGERQPWEELAYKAAKRSCDEDYDMSSCQDLAWAHLNGWGVPKKGPGWQEPLLESCQRGSGKACVSAAKHASTELIARLGSALEQCGAEPRSNACYAVFTMCQARVPGACEACEQLVKDGAAPGARCW